MSRHWVGPSLLSVFIVMVLLPGSLSAQRRRGFDFRCSQVKSSFERQISTLKLQQQDDLNECRTAYGKKSDLCRDLKEQQKEAMHQLKYSRDLDLRGCNQQPTIFADEDVVVRPSQNTGGCGRRDGETYVDNDDEKSGKPPGNNPGPAKIGPPETDGSPGTTANHPPAKIGPPEQDGSGTAGSSNQVRTSHNPPRPMPADTGNSGGGSRSSGGFNSSANSSGNTHSSGSVHSSGSGNSNSSYSGGGSASHGSSGGSYSGGGGYSGGSSSASSSASHSSGGSGASVSTGNSGGSGTKH
jgi:hypothetical protein